MAYNAIGGAPPKENGRVEWQKHCNSFGLDTKEFSDPHRKYEDHIFQVYMHTNKINGKVYVGITHHVNPNKRWGYSGQKYTNSNKFVNAINKYGWENFDHTILCRTNKERAVVIEKALIAHYKRMGMSYNLSDGGDGAEAITEENRKKISERMRNNHPMKGKHHTPEARAKISEANKQRVYTEEQKEHLKQVSKLGRQTMLDRGWWMSEEGKKKVAEYHSKPVLQMDLDGNVIKEFKSAVEADRFLSNGKGHHISDVCNGKRKTAYGYKWKYKEERRSI